MESCPECSAIAFARAFKCPCLDAKLSALRWRRLPCAKNPLLCRFAFGVPFMTARLLGTHLRKGSPTLQLRALGFDQRDFTSRGRTAQQRVTNGCNTAPQGVSFEKCP